MVKGRGKVYAFGDLACVVVSKNKFIVNDLHKIVYDPQIHNVVLR